MVKAGFGFGEFIEFTTTSRLDSLTPFSYSLKVGHKASGTYDGQTYKIVILFVTNISGIIKGELRVN